MVFRYEVRHVVINRVKSLTEQAAAAVLDNSIFFFSAVISYIVLLN